MIKTCPNRNHPDYKKLVDYYGPTMAMAIFSRNGNQIPDLSKYNNMVELTKEFFPETRSMDEPMEELFQRQKNILSQSLKAEIILDASIKGSGQIDLGKNKRVIRVNPQYFREDTLIHEYGHLYIDLLGGMNNPMIQQGRRYLNGTDLESEITNSYPELKGDKLDKEILSTAIGLEGKEIFKAREGNLITRFKNWLDLFYNRLKSIVGLEYNIAKELARQLLSDQISDQLVDELQIETYQQKRKIGSPLMRESDILKNRANIIQRIKDGLTTKLALYNKLLNNSTNNTEIKKSIGKLKALVTEFGKKEDAESLTRYISIGLRETDLMLNRVRDFQSGKLRATTRGLRAIHNYIQSYSYAKEIRDHLEFDSDLSGKLREGTLDDSEKENLLDALDKIISNHSKIYSMYRQLSKVVLADKFSVKDGKIHAMYREQFNKEFINQNKRSRSVIRSNTSYSINGKEVSEKEYNEAKTKYVNEKMIEHKYKIQEEEKQHLMNIFDLGPTDLGITEAFMMDPGNINDDIIQIVHEQIERADFRAMQHSINKFKDADDIYTKFNKVETSSNPIKKYDKLIENEVDENGNLTGKKSNYMVSRYYSKIYEIRQDFYNRIDAAKDEGNIEKAREIEHEFSNWLKENTKRVSIDHYEPIKKWLNPQYDVLQKLKDNKSPIAEMYEFIIDLRNDTDYNYPNVNKLNRESWGVFYKLPSMNANNTERIIDKGLIETVKENIKDILNVRSTDTEYRPEQVEEEGSTENETAKEIKRITKVMGNESGELVQNIPIHFRGKISSKDQSYDLLSIHLIDNNMATNYKEKSLIHADVEMLRFLSETRGVGKTKPSFGKGLHKLVNVFTGKDESQILVEGTTETHKALVSLIESRMYGINKLGNKQINKMTDAINSWTGDTMLIGNWLAASANIMQGKAMNFIESTGATEFSTKDLLIGEQKYWEDMPSWGKDFGRRRFYSKTNLLIEKFNALADWSSLTRRFVDDTRLKGLLKKSTLHGLNSGAEHYIQSTAMYAMLNSIKVKDFKGNYLTRNEDGTIGITDDIEKAMSLDEAYDIKDGRLELNEMVASTTNTIPGREGNALSNEEIEDISFMMRDVNDDLQGQYDSRKKAQMSRIWYFRMFELLRRWLPRGWMKRFRGFTTVALNADDISIDEKFYSRARGAFKSGIYTDLFRTIWNKKYIEKLREDGLKASFELMSKNWNELSDLEYANVRRGITEFSLMMITVSMAYLFKGLADDDDDEYSKKGLYYITFLMARLNSELMFYINPIETVRILKSPAASLSILLDGINLGQQLLKDFPFTDPEVYERGRRKGQLKLRKSFEDLFPLFNQLNRTVEESVGWLFQEQVL